MEVCGREFTRKAVEEFGEAAVADLFEDGGLGEQVKHKRGGGAMACRNAGFQD